MRKLMAVVIIAIVGTAVFQNCGKAFNPHDVASSAPSIFPTDYQPYGNIPSQGVTALPPAYKVKARSSANAGGTSLTCTKPTGCYR